LTTLALRVATFNISGGEKTFEEFSHATQRSHHKTLEILIKRMDADVLCFQEASQYIDIDGIAHSLMDEIRLTREYEHFFFGTTLSMETHMQVKKDIMVKGIFNDWWNWSKGNAIYSRVPFGLLSDPARSGVPRNIPLYRPISYEGNRDSDPRCALLTRLKVPPYPFLSTLHLTTLVGERQPPVIPRKNEQAYLLRYQQMCRFLDLVRKNVLEKDEPLILTGDFNATSDEFCIAYLLETENGFVRLIPENEGPTHTGIEKPVDHIFFYPRSRLVEYNCWIEAGDLSKRASDHLPVVADLKIK